MKPTKSQPIYSLFALKAIAAFLVVMCHIPMITQSKWMPVMRTAVPLFFMISGYFLYDIDMKKSYARAIRSLKNVIPIILIVNLLYFLFVPSVYGNPIQSLDRVIVWIVYGYQASGHLWYLTAMAEALMILALLFRLGLSKVILFLPLLVLGNVLSGHYSFLFEGIIPRMDVFTVIFSGLPMMSIGYLIHRYESRLLAFRHWLPILVVTLAISWVEYVWVKQTQGVVFGNISMMTTPCVVALMVLALQSPQWGRNWRRGILIDIGQRYSGNIYYFHLAVGAIVAKLFTMVGLSPIYKIAGVPIVFALCVALAWLIQRLQDRIGIHILR